jgi:hypothetical protein
MEMETRDNPGSQVTEAVPLDTNTDGIAINKDQSFYLNSVVFLVRKVILVKNKTNQGKLHFQG